MTMNNQDIRIEVEAFDEALIQDLQPLFMEQWQEVGELAENYPLHINIEKYKTLAQQQLLVILVARDTHQVPVGYLVLIRAQSLHAADAEMAMEDAYFVRTAYRQNGIGRSLILAAKTFCKQAGIVSLQIAERVESPISELMEAVGGVLVERIYEVMN